MLAAIIFCCILLYALLVISVLELGLFSFDATGPSTRKRYFGDSHKGKIAYALCVAFPIVGFPVLITLSRMCAVAAKKERENQKIAY